MDGWKNLLKKLWHFIWEDNSVWSWIANIALAFILIKFIVYPGLGFILSTSHPVVAVVSESMEHNMNFYDWWEENKNWCIGENECTDETDILGEQLVGKAVLRIPFLGYIKIWFVEALNFIGLA